MKWWEKLSANTHWGGWASLSSLVRRMLILSTSWHGWAGVRCYPLSLWIRERIQHCAAAHHPRRLAPNLLAQKQRDTGLFFSMGVSMAAPLREAFATSAAHAQKPELCFLFVFGLFFPAPFSCWNLSKKNYFHVIPALFLLARALDVVFSLWFFDILFIFIIHKFFWSSLPSLWEATCNPTDWLRVL